MRCAVEVKKLELSERLARARKARGLSQAEAAERLNVSRQAISRWETGTGMPTLDNLIQMGKLYQVSLDELVYGAEGEEAPGEVPESEVPPEEPEPVQAPKRRRPALLAVLALVAVGALVFGIWGVGLMIKGKEDRVGSVIVIGAAGNELDKLPLDRAGERVGPFAEVEPVEQELGIRVLEDTEYRSGSNFRRDFSFIYTNDTNYLSITVTNNGTKSLLFGAGYWEEDRWNMLNTQIPAGATVTRTFTVEKSGGGDQPQFTVDVSAGSAGGTVDIQISAVEFKR